jgi:NADPH:quinone reductase-like Zn-dependent oxidoreductase
MKAAVINQWGPPGIIELAEMNMPEPGPGQLLVRVYASGINPVDWKHRYGNHRLILGAHFPIVLGYDVCGEVVATGKLVYRFKTGDIVFGDLDNKYGGGLAEYCCGSESCFAVKPDTVVIEEAAAASLVSLTALQALRDKAHLKSGQSLIINGASGGVGHVAIQIARIMGARTIAISSGKSRSFVMDLKPDLFLDYTQEDVLKFNEKVDVFFDVKGNHSLPKCRHLLKPGGIYITTLPRPKVFFHQLLRPFLNGKSSRTLLRKHNAEDMQCIAGWMQEGRLKISIDKVFDIQDISKAYGYAEQGHSRGKNVVRITGNIPK